MANIKANRNNSSSIHANIVHNNNDITANISSETNAITTEITPEGSNINSNVISREININSNINENVNNILTNPSAYPSATETKKGIIRIATEQEAIEGIDTKTAITPFTLKRVTDTYIHTQGVASDTWVINHNLNKNPSIMIIDSAGNVVEGAEKYIDRNTIEIYFNGAFKGKAYLN